jgi:hypothetical protein
MSNPDVPHVKEQNYERNHRKRYPFPAIRINGLHRILVHLKFPPVCWADGDIASGPEEQRCVCEEGDEHGDPNPNILANILLCPVTIADPAPILSQHVVNTARR